MKIIAVKKPVTIESVKYLGTEKSLREVMEFMGEKVETKDTISQHKFTEYYQIVSRDGLIIKTLEGQYVASVGDYIIKGVKGEFYPCKPDIFDMTYDIVGKEALDEGLLANDDRHMIISSLKKYGVVLPEDDCLWENEDFLEVVADLYRCVCRQKNI
jgi:hypothetical protein